MALEIALGIITALWLLLLIGFAAGLVAEYWWQILLGTVLVGAMWTLWTLTAGDFYARSNLVLGVLIVVNAALLGPPLWKSWRRWREQERKRDKPFEW